MSDAIKRGARSFGQGFLGVLATSGVVIAVRDTGNIDRDALIALGVSAFAGGVIGLISWAQNALEDAGKIPSILKTKKEA